MISVILGNATMFLIPAIIAASISILLFIEYRQDRDRPSEWTHHRVANYYGACLDVRYGFRPNIFTSEIHSPSAVRWHLKAGNITTAQVDEWLKEMGCNPLPAEAHPGNN